MRTILKTELPLERRGTLIYTCDRGPGTAECLAECKTAEIAEAIVTVLNRDFKPKTLMAIKRVNSIQDLPDSNKFTLPNWEQENQYRVTAWAYLNRWDGGKFVIHSGVKYQLDERI